MKRLLSLMLVVLMIMALVVGCSNDADQKGEATGKVDTKQDESKEDTKEEAKDPVELTFSIWDNNQKEGMEAVAAAFTEQNPHVTVKVEVTPWNEYWTKLEASAVGNSMPDIFWMHTNEFFKYATNKKLMPIEDDMIDQSKFSQGLVDLFTYEGTLYGVPKDFDTIAIFYNKELFDAAGEAYPDDTWDWDKLVEVAQALTDVENGIYGLGAPYQSQNGFYPFIYQNGGTVITEDGKSGYALPETQEAVQFYFDMIHKYKVSPTLEYFAENGTNDTFTSGKLAMFITGSWKMKSFSQNEIIADKFDVAVLAKGKERASISNGLTFSGANDTEHPEEVRAFLEFAATEEAHIIQGKSGAAIPAYENTQSYWVELFPDYNVNVFVEMLDYSVPFPTTPSKPKWGEVESSTLKAFGTGELAAEDAFPYLAEEMDKILEKE
ncbi:ABC transporter substrate-binding protein [Vallitalea okinawensis]|uniref:ABC transporter substrate-binding protein n=1 Tax=Vallitalea okinawensis TaxID=2078660 RepID=UPI0013008F0A|nr:sugar ABC transporter substrate-binding protein [Vallitalea okinawensis]